MIHIEVTLDHNTGIDATTTQTAHDDLTHPTEDAATDLAMTDHTSHITDHANIKALKIIDPKTAVDHIHDHPTDLQGMNPANQVQIPAGQEEDHIPRRT